MVVGWLTLSACCLFRMLRNALRSVVVSDASVCPTFDHCDTAGSGDRVCGMQSAYSARWMANSLMSAVGA